MSYSFSSTLLSDQITRRELQVILRELQSVITRDIPGDVVEFGCYVGTTSVHLAALLADTQRELYLYDSFEGLPDKSPQDDSPAGLQFQQGKLQATKKQLLHNLKQAGVPLPHIIKGWFSDVTSDQVPVHIAYAFLDGDYYRSVYDPLKLIWPHLSSGGVVVVDDYQNEALPGASKAVDEWLQTHPVAHFRTEASLAIFKKL